MDFDTYRRWGNHRSKGVIFYSVMKTAKYVTFLTVIIMGFLLLLSESSLTEIGLTADQLKIGLLLALPIWLGTIAHWFIQERRYHLAKRRHMDYVMKYD